jgi:hypothetical protein
MNTRKRSAVAVAIVVASLSLSACEEQVVPTQQTKDAAPRLEVPADDRRIITSGSQTPPPSAPPEYQHLTWINVTADVGWVDAHTAYGQAIVQYGANNATADITLSVRNASGVIIAQSSAHGAESWVFPSDHTLRQSTNVYVTSTCGNVAQAAASGTAWDSWMNTSQNMFKWGDRAQSDTKSSAQAACPPPPTCQDVTATNYGAPLPCAYPPPPPTGGAPVPPSGTGYPGQYYTPPGYSVGHWECTRWNVGTPYEVQNCVWLTGYRSRSPMTLPSLTRSAAPETPVRTQSTADLPSVFVIVSDQVPTDAIAVIERHRTGPLRNVLLIPSSTIRPAVFVAAMQALYDSRDKDGDTPTKDLSLTLRGTILDQHIPLASREYAAAFTAQIASSRKSNAGAYGIRQMIEFKLGAKN